LFLRKFRQSDPDFGVLDLKTFSRRGKYSTVLIKTLPQKPDAIFVSQLFQNIAAFDSIRTTKSPV
jgi:hypothetical protein